MSRPSLPMTEAEARRPDPAVETAAVALVKRQITPGHAGKGTAVHRSRCSSTVHPRVCGERAIKMTVTIS